MTVIKLVQRKNPSATSSRVWSGKSHERSCDDVKRVQRLLAGLIPLQNHGENPMITTLAAAEEVMRLNDGNVTKAAPKFASVPF